MLFTAPMQLPIVVLHEDHKADAKTEHVQLKVHNYQQKEEEKGLVQSSSRNTQELPRYLYMFLLVK